MMNETRVRAGGDTIIITLAGDTWVAAGATFDAQRQAIINGLDSAQSEATGWNAEVRDKLPVTAVARTSDTVATITLTAQSGHNITAPETITVTVPGSAVTGGNPITATPTFQVLGDPTPTLPQWLPWMFGETFDAPAAPWTEDFWTPAEMAWLSGPGEVLISGTLIGVGSLSGTLSVVRAIEATVNGAGVLTGSLTGVRSLEPVTIAGVGALSGVLHGIRSLDPITIQGIGSLSGVLQSVTGPFAPVTIIGVGLLTGDLTRLRAMDGTMLGVGVLSGAMTRRIALDALITAAGLLSGTMTRRVALDALIQSVGVLSGDLTRRTLLPATTIQGIGILLGTLQTAGDATITATILGQGSLSGVLTGERLLDALISGQGVAQGELTRVRSLEGLLGGQGALLGELTGLVTFEPVLILGRGELTGLLATPGEPLFLRVIDRSMQTYRIISMGGQRFLLRHVSRPSFLVEDADVQTFRARDHALSTFRVKDPSYV